MERCTPEIGDIIFVMKQKETSWIQRAIMWATNGPTFHVSLYAGDGKVFETDGSYGKAMFFPFSKYEGHAIDVYRMALLTEEDRKKVVDVCKLLEGTPYSYQDIVVKFLLGPFVNRNFRWAMWLEEKLNTDKRQICNELAMHILWTVTGYPPFEHHGEWTPATFRDLCRKLFPEVFNIVC